MTGTDGPERDTRPQTPTQTQTPPPAPARPWVTIFVVGILVGALVAGGTILATVLFLRDSGSNVQTQGDERAPRASSSQGPAKPAKPRGDDGKVTPAPAGFPGPTTTGVPADAKLKKSEGLTVTEEGAVIEDLHIQGSVKIDADNVTIRRSLIDSTSRYPVQLMGDAKGLLIEDSEIDGNGTAGVAILKAGYTLRRVNIHSVMDGPRIEGDNVVIEDSWIHDLTRVEGGHHDTIQIRKGNDIQIRGNTLRPYKASTNDRMNAAIQIGSMMGPMSGLVVEGNYLDGGNYTINGAAGGRETAVYRNNKFGRDFKYGVDRVGDAQWDDSNVWADNGKPVRADGT
jgi:hypothetical protein